MPVFGVTRQRSSETKKVGLFEGSLKLPQTRSCAEPGYETRLTEIAMTFVPGFKNFLMS